MLKVKIGKWTYAGENYQELYKTLVAHEVKINEKPKKAEGFEELVKKGGITVTTTET